MYECWSPYFGVLYNFKRGLLEPSQILKAVAANFLNLPWKLWGQCPLVFCGIGTSERPPGIAGSSLHLGRVSFLCLSSSLVCFLPFSLYPFSSSVTGHSLSRGLLEHCQLVEVWPQIFQTLSRKDIKVLRTQALSLGHVSSSSGKCLTVALLGGGSGIQQCLRAMSGSDMVIRKENCPKHTEKCWQSPVLREWSLALSWGRPPGENALRTEAVTGVFHACRLEISTLKAVMRPEPLLRASHDWVVLGSGSITSHLPLAVLVAFSVNTILLLFLDQSLGCLRPQKWCWTTVWDKCGLTVQGRGPKSKDILGLSSSSWAFGVVSWESWSSECTC